MSARSYIWSDPGTASEFSLNRNGYMESSFIRKTPISGYSLGSLYGSLCIRGLRRICSPPVSVNLSSPKPGHTTGGSGRHGAGRTAGRGDAGQNKVPTFRLPWKPTAPLALQRTVNKCSKRPFASKNKGNPMQTAEGTKRPVDHRFIRGLLRGPRALFVAGC